MSKLPESWKEHRLKEMFELRKGKKVNITDKSSKESIPYIAIENLRGGPISKFTNDDNGLMCNPSDLLLVWDGANCGTVGFRLNGFVGSTITRLRKIDDCIDENYAFKFLKSKFKYFNTHITGATIPHLEKNSVINLIIPIPPIDIQKKIVTTLEKVEQLKQWRIESDKLTDDYLNSTFFEMFGDLTNYKTERLDELIEDDSHISYGIVQPGDEFNMGIPVIRPVDIIDNRLIREKIKKVNPKIEEKYKRTRLQGDEILITVRGTTGNTVITDNRCNGFNVTRGIALIRPNVKKINVEYLNEFLKSYLGSKYIQEHTKGATLKQINIKDLKAMPIPQPPRDLQDSFAKAVKNVNQMKAYQKSSEKQIDNLFNILMQKAFRGELVC